MAGVRESCVGAHLALDEWRLRVDTGIDEDHAFAPGEVERVLDLQLEVDQHLDARHVRRFESCRQQRTHGIVAPARVAHGKHQRGRDAHPRTIESATEPSASSSSTDSGILPTACVAHDRQGSNARTATSM